MFKQLLICVVLAIACISFTNALNAAPFIVPSIASSNSQVAPLAIHVDPTLSNITVVTTINSTNGIDDTIPISIASYSYNQENGATSLKVTDGHYWKQNTLTFSEQFIHQTPDATQTYYQLYAPLQKHLEQTNFHFNANVSATNPDGSHYNQVANFNISFVPNLAEKLIVKLDTTDNMTIPFNISLHNVLVTATRLYIDFDPHSTSVSLFNENGTNTCNNGATYTLNQNQLAFPDLTIQPNTTVNLICPGLVLKSTSATPINTKDLLVSVYSTNSPYPAINVYFNEKTQPDNDDKKHNMTAIIIAAVIIIAIVILAIVIIAVVKKRAQPAANDAYQPLNVHRQDY